MIAKNFKKSNGEALLRVEDIKKNFVVGGQELPVLKGISLQVNKGDFAIIFGPSGCGKSTLLHTILGMERPTEGRVWMEGKDLYSMTEDEIVKFRKARVGVVFQQPIWIKSLNVIENVCLPNRLKGKDEKMAMEMAMEMLRLVKLEAWAYHHPSELSSGQQQRVSLARALTIDPLVIVADEPTGNLDTAAGDELMDLLNGLSREKEKTILMVTHDLEYLRYANKLFHIIDGELKEEGDGRQIRRLNVGLKNKKGERQSVTVRDGNYLSKNHIRLMH